MRYLKKNTVLRVVGYLNLLAFIYFVGWLDINLWVSVLGCGVTGGYLTLFAYANNWFEGGCM